MLLFWLPVPGLVVGCVLALRPGEARKPLDGGLAAVLAVGACVYLGVFPRADFNHLINVYQPVLIAGMIVVQRLWEGSARPRTVTARACIAFGCTLLGLYVFTAGSWYLHTLGSMQSKLPQRRGGVLVTAIFSRVPH